MLPYCIAGTGDKDMKESRTPCHPKAIVTKMDKISMIVGRAVTMMTRTRSDLVKLTVSRRVMTFCDCRPVVSSPPPTIKDEMLAVFMSMI